jgi:signal transduction histidine kinase
LITIAKRAELAGYYKNPASLVRFFIVRISHVSLSMINSQIPRPFRSLRIRLLIPLVTTSLCIALIVAIVSAWLGSQWGKRTVDGQFAGMERTLRESSFPMTEPVLKLLAELTQSDLISYDRQGERLYSTFTDIELPSWLVGGIDETQSEGRALGTLVNGEILELDGRRFHVYQVRRNQQSSGNDTTDRILVFFDHKRVAETSNRAALLPLATALPTILVLATVAYYLSNRWIGRLRLLQQHVGRVARGDFENDSINNLENDEVGALQQSVNKMSAELKQLWGMVRQQQSSRVLNQLASGLAHQLRNTLTGARMALELFQRRQSSTEEEIDVALREMQQAEEYIKRLLRVGKGEREAERPASIGDCMQHIAASLTVMANHLGVELTWQVADDAKKMEVCDGASLIAAVSNLGINAIQEADKVSIRVDRLDDEKLRILVSDNGPGVREDVAANIFEPLVTTKPEGAGLGLALVKRAAETLGGDVGWFRQDGVTCFEMTVAQYNRQLNESTE